MKICPQCQTNYTDDTLRFCLQDGTPLADPAFSGDVGEQETVLSPRQTEKVRTPVTNAQSQNWTQGSEPVLPVAPKKTNTTKIIALTALLTLVAVAAGGAGVWFYLRGDRRQAARNTNSKPVNAGVPNVSQTPNANSNANAKPSATPTPKPTLNPKEIKNIQSDVENVVDDWRDALENLDLEAHLRNYAETVDYYRAGAIGIGAVRADKQRAFESYDSIDLDISNLKITPDASGEKVIAVFDKEWNFEGAASLSSGKVQQELQLTRSGGKWRITGEKDLQVYYTNK